MTDKVIMTDKEIKMVDVDKCKYRDSCSNFCLAERDAIGESRTICTGTNCYFKQFQRKEQECEKYEQALNKILEIALISNMPPCLEDEANCDKCDDDVTGNGTKCMQYGLCKKQDIISKEVIMEGKEHLTNREKEILRWFCFSSKEIAKFLFISECTVKSHVHSILKKLKARTKSQAIILSLVMGEIKLDEVVIKPPNL